ncbi:MAG: hypothetical protein CM15mV36_1930 [Caudoviricetes sp.]|nr:MAG: hypothetical protein CM15mV36_1930 [Caudoviricetes sp.]
MLYKAPIDASASTVLSVTAQGGSNTSYDVAVKDYDQHVVLDASTYKLHTGDVFTGYRFNLGTAVGADQGLNVNQVLTSADGEKSAVFESFYIPPFTSIVVKSKAIRSVAVESVTGTFAVGNTISKGSGGNTSVATIFAVASGSGGSTLYIGPSTLNGSGTEFTDGDSITASGGATGTISSGGVGTAANEFTFTTSGGTEDLYLGTSLSVLGDRTYRFDVSDSSMSGLVFKLSEVVNGEWGPDGTAGNTDDGTEYTTGKTTNGTAGSSGAYVQYDLTANTSLPASLYFYEGTTGTAANSNYGGSDRIINTSSSYSYDSVYVYNVSGTWVNNTDTFTYNGVTYTVTSQTAGPYGYVRDYTGTALYVVLGEGSANIAGSDTFLDNPKLATGARSTVTVSSVTSSGATVETKHYIRKDNAITANTTEEIKSLVIGPGQRLVVENNDADCSFTLVGFEDSSTGFTTRAYAQTTGTSGSGGGS